MTLHDHSPGASFLSTLFDQTLAADTVSIDTGAILPGEFSSLWVVTYLRTDEAVTASGVYLTFNGDTATNYGNGYLQESSSSASASSGDGIGGVYISANGASAAANFFAAANILIPNYSGTVGYKSAMQLGGNQDTTAANFNFIARGTSWKNTAAINRVALNVITGGKKLKAGSRMTVYGMA